METGKVRHARLTPGRVTLASGAVVLVSAAMPWVLDGTGWDYFRLSTSPAKLLFDLPKTEGIGLFFTGLVAALSGVLTILLGAALLRARVQPHCSISVLSIPPLRRLRLGSGRFPHRERHECPYPRRWRHCLAVRIHPIRPLDLAACGPGGNDGSVGRRQRPKPLSLGSDLLRARVRRVLREPRTVRVGDDLTAHISSGLRSPFCRSCAGIAKGLLGAGGDENVFAAFFGEGAAVEAAV